MSPTHVAEARGEERRKKQILPARGHWARAKVATQPSWRAQPHRRLLPNVCGLPLTHMAAEARLPIPGVLACVSAVRFYTGCTK